MKGVILRRKGNPHLKIIFLLPLQQQTRSGRKDMKFMYKNRIRDVNDLNWSSLTVRKQQKTTIFLGSKANS